MRNSIETYGDYVLSYLTGTHGLLSLSCSPPSAPLPLGCVVSRCCFLSSTRTERPTDQIAAYLAAGLLSDSGCNLISALDDEIRQLQNVLTQ